MANNESQSVGIHLAFYTIILQPIRYLSKANKKTVKACISRLWGVTLPGIRKIYLLISL